MPLGNQMNLFEVAREIARRLTSIFLQDEPLPDNRCRARMKL